jgi:hypothetical protein
VAQHVAGVVRKHAPEECYLSINKEAHHWLWRNWGPEAANPIVKVLPLDLAKIEKSELLGRFPGIA